MGEQTDALRVAVVDMGTNSTRLLVADVAGGELDEIERESRVTRLGACVGRTCDQTLVVDIGGGSTELVVGSGDEVAFHASLQAGVVRHSERYVKTDPPLAADLEELANDVRGLVGEAVAE